MKDKPERDKMTSKSVKCKPCTPCLMPLSHVDEPTMPSLELPATFRLITDDLSALSALAV
jgi:hypothetical protein